MSNTDDRRTWNTIFESIPDAWFAAPPSDAMNRCRDFCRRRAVHRLLDVGAGIGRWSVHLSRSGVRRIVAVDSAQRGARIAAEWAAREGVAIAAVAGDVVALPFADGAFDAIVAALVLEHVDRDGRRTAVAEIDRVSSSGALGFFVLNPLMTEAEATALANAGNPTAACHTTPCGDEEIESLLRGWKGIERATSAEGFRLLSGVRG